PWRENSSSARKHTNQTRFYWLFLAALVAHGVFVPFGSAARGQGPLVVFGHPGLQTWTTLSGFSMGWSGFENPDRRSRQAAPEFGRNHQPTPLAMERG